MTRRERDADAYPARNRRGIQGIDPIEAITGPMHESLGH
jgi:hypothetical protein